MRALLISANRENINMVALPLGLAGVAAATRAHGHEVELVDLMASTDVSGDVARVLASLDPEVIGVSVRNIDDQNMYRPLFLLDQAREVVDICRACSSAPVVVGGAGYSIFPVAALDYLGADLGLRGEGEAAFPELLRRMQAREDLDDLPGLYRPGVQPPFGPAYVADLDTLPRPDLSAWRERAAVNPDLWLPVQTRRGCPLRCSYCSTPAIEGTRVRKSSPRAAAEYIAGQVAAGFRRVFFTDNTFNLPPSFAKELCRAMVDTGHSPQWRGILYPGGVDKELIELMARSGCIEVSLGFESGCPRVIRAMNKRYTPAEVRQVRAMLRDVGIRAMGFLLLGGPEEDRDSVRESLDFAADLDLDLLRVTVGPRIYPDTSLARQAVARGLLAPDDSLLEPRFYLEPGLTGWIEETAREWSVGRPNLLLNV